MTPPKPLYRPSKLERVEVVWVDAQADSVYDGTVEGYEGTLPVLEDVGYFVRMDRKVVTLASCREPSSGTVRFMLNIPRSLVREIRRLDLRKDVSDAV